jgi:hypothetical protein
MTRNQEIANTILQQLGGANRLVMMTGAYNFVAIQNGLSFKIPTKNPKANYIKITLNGKDLYDLEVGRIRGNSYKVVSQYDDLYFDMLKPSIEKATGMYLSLFEKGGGISKFRKGGSVGEAKNKNANYLDGLPSDKKSRILKNIASHYGISVADAEDEVRDEDAEMLYEYIANDKSLRMEVYNDMERGKMAKGGLMENEYKKGVVLVKSAKATNNNDVWEILNEKWKKYKIVNSRKFDLETPYSRGWIDEGVSINVFLLKDTTTNKFYWDSDYVKAKKNQMAKGGKTKQDPPIVRGYFEDEPIDYGQGGSMAGWCYSIGGL